MPDQRGFAGLGPAAGSRGLSDRQAGRRHLRAGRRAGHRALRAGRPRLGRRDRLGGGAARRSAPDPARDRQLAAPGDLPEEPDRGRRPARRLAIHHRLPHARRSSRRSRRWASTLLRQDLRPACRPRADPGGREAAISRRLVAARRADRDAQLVPRIAADRAAAGRDRAAARLAAPAPSPRCAVPTLVIWGMQDKALLPLQLDGLDAAGRRSDDRAPARRRPFRAVGSARRGRRRARALPCRRKRAATAPAA